ncbi:TRAP transporter small permease subunit [Pelagibius sp. Alg239-R121]|uniref:TRAP transporter small permease subunit n=1 Tax=Pelagibius sp. Alg239-R121 TaxID=2993448 RepID=UPI0024A710B8|nr:TRAP transporter small permease [Pelagibius sp. Alg239-R121]
MASTSVRTDDSTLSWADRQLFRVESTLNLMAGLVVFTLMLLAVAQILGRKIFNAPIPGFIDWVEQFMVVFAFLGVAYCQRLGGHIRMDIVIGKARGRPLWLAEVVSVALMMLVISALIYGGFLHFERALNIGDSTIDIALPTWPAKLIVPVALGLLWLRLLVQLIGYGRALWNGEEIPVAVPMIEDAAAIAKREAEETLGEDLDGEARP